MSIPTTSAQAAEWLAPVQLGSPAVEGSASTSDASPAAALAAQGEAIAVWSATTGGGVDHVVQASVTPPGSGAWQGPSDLSSAGEAAYAPRVAVDEAGDAVAVWSAWNGSSHVIQASVRPAARGAWQPAVTLAQAGQAAADAQVAVNPQGEAVVTWAQEEGFAQSIEAVAGDVATGVWQTPATLSTAGQAVSEPAVAVQAQGDAIVAWSSQAAGGQIQASLRASADGAWQAPRTVSATGGAASPRTAIDGDRALVVWEALEGYLGVIQFSQATLSGGAWQTPAALSASSGQKASHPQIAVDGAGDAIAVWERSNTLNLTVQSAFMPAASQTWQAPTEVAVANSQATRPGPPGPVECTPPYDCPAYRQQQVEPQLAVDAQGTALAVWRHSGIAGESASIEAAGAPTGGGAWGAPAAISSIPGFAPQIALDGQGEAVSVWETADAVQAAEYGADTPLGQPGPSPGGTPVSSPSPSVRRPAMLFKASLSRRRFRVAALGRAARRDRQAARDVRPALPRGTTIQLVLSEPATVGIEIARLQRARLKTVAQLTTDVASGGTSGVYFDGRIRGRALNPGRYVALVTAQSAGGRSQSIELPFEIVR